jgi:hypothetical protein
MSNPDNKLLARPDGGGTYKHSSWVQTGDNVMIGS